MSKLTTETTILTITLKELRVCRGLNVEEVAERAGLEVTDYINLEAGVNDVLTMDNLCKVAYAIGFQLSNLFRSCEEIAIVLCGSGRWQIKSTLKEGEDELRTMADSYAFKVEPFDPTLTFPAARLGFFRYVTN